MNLKIQLEGAEVSLPALLSRDCMSIYFAYLMVYQGDIYHIPTGSYQSGKDLMPARLAFLRPILQV